MSLFPHSVSGSDYNNALLRAGLDEVKFGVVLLDSELRAQFINRAFRRMWRFPDAKAETKPAFVALMYHGRDTRAYDVPEQDLDAYIAERVHHVQTCGAEPRDLRLRNGEVIRFQCVALPDGGRMLSYTFVTDIVQRTDELEVVHAALDTVNQGVILLDAQLNVRFANRAVRKLWGISAERLAQKPPFLDLVRDTRFRENYRVPDEAMDDFVASRMAIVRSGDARPVDVPLSDGRTLRAQCTMMPDGGRMLTYTNVTDFVENTQLLEHFANTDSLTGIYNRRRCLELADIEWDRFQRYQRPVSLLVFDIDRFKAINDMHGHHAGDLTIAHVSAICNDIKRTSDIAARIGGDEFALLLPETESSQAMVVAERLRAAVQQRLLALDNEMLEITLSIGLAQATLSQPSITALMRAADEALYDAKRRGRNRISLAAERPFEDIKHAAE